MKIQGEGQLLGIPVVDRDGRRVGRVLAAYCAPDRYSLVWLVLRLPGLRRRVRAVPSVHAQWRDSADGLEVPYRLEEIRDSPAVDENSLDSSAVREAVAAFYAVTQR